MFYYFSILPKGEKVDINWNIPFYCHWYDCIADGVPFLGGKYLTFQGLDLCAPWPYFPGGGHFYP